MYTQKHKYIHRHAQIKMHTLRYMHTYIHALEHCLKTHKTHITMWIFIWLEQTTGYSPLLAPPHLSKQWRFRLESSWRPVLHGHSSTTTQNKTQSRWASEANQVTAHTFRSASRSAVSWTESSTISCTAYHRIHEQREKQRKNRVSHALTYRLQICSAHLILKLCR